MNTSNKIKLLIASKDDNYNLLMADALSRNPGLVTNKLQLMAFEKAKVSEGLSFLEADSPDPHLLLVSTADDLCKQDCHSCSCPADCPLYLLALPGRQLASSWQLFYLRQAQTVLAPDELAWPTSRQVICQLLADQFKQISPRQADPLARPRGPVLDLEKKSLLCMNLQLQAASPCNLKELIRQQVNAGYRVIYLPLMPLWYMSLSSKPDSCGPCLSDLLLAIHQQCPPTAEELGLYLQSHQEGYLQFRPPVRSDDLISCKLEYLKQLVILVKEYLSDQTNPAICWLDCLGLSINTTASLAVLCDCILPQLPLGKSFAELAARREFNLIMNSLPSSCRLYEGQDSFLEKEVY